MHLPLMAPRPLPNCHCCRASSWSTPTKRRGRSGARRGRRATSQSTLGSAPSRSWGAAAAAARDRLLLATTAEGAALALPLGSQPAIRQAPGGSGGTLQQWAAGRQPWRLQRGCRWPGVRMLRLGALLGLGSGGVHAVYTFRCAPTQYLKRHYRFQPTRLEALTGG